MEKIDRGQLANAKLAGGCCKSKTNPQPDPTPVPR